MQTNRITKHIDRLLLDPNNYRFIDKAEYLPVPSSDIASPRIQQRTLNFLLGNKNNNISDLISSFKTNGFLDIDQIQVKALGNYYLVLEGNRRIATLKFLYEEFKKGNDTGLIAEADFKSINLVEITEDDEANHLITMGLHHISGKKRWSAVNEAQLIQDLLYKHQKSETDICNSLGITTHSLRRGQSTYALIQQYKASDFGDQFTANKYSIFEAVISNPQLKAWIQWDESTYTAKNHVNLERFFSWISQTEETDWNGDKEERVIREPLLTQYRQVKEVASFINDEAALQRMEESRSIAEGYSESHVIGENKLRAAISEIKKSIRLAYNYRELIDNRLYDDFNSIQNSLSNLVPESKAKVFISERKAPLLFPNPEEQFSHVFIKQYRKLKNLEVNNISRVNIFAGGNNIGKTSLLEAIYLLSRLNMLEALLELERYRGKFLSEFHSKWVEKNFISDITINATFNKEQVAINYSKTETEENIERLGYLKTIEAEASVANNSLTSHIHLFANKEPELRYQEVKTLCNAAFTSPYRYNEKLLHTAHKIAIENKYYEQIIGFIQSHLDPEIQKIDLVNDEGENRFKVTAANLDVAIDITKYGEGLQRIFEIAFLLGYCQNGILCIDEVDSAIHKNLLTKFTEFIQQTAKDFNVQVFVTTHSKECIDAFVENDYPDHELTAYALNEEEGRIVCRYLEGEKLKGLVEAINLDIR